MSPDTKKPSFPALLSHMVKTEGVSSIYAGLSAALMRQAIYGTARIGLHRTFSDKLQEVGAGSSSVVLILLCFALLGFAFWASLRTFVALMVFSLWQFHVFGHTMRCSVMLSCHGVRPLSTLKTVAMCFVGWVVLWRKNFSPRARS